MSDNISAPEARCILKNYIDAPHTDNPQLPRRNMLACSRCASMHKKCNMSHPYTSSTCEACSRDGVDCPPHKPRKKYRKRSKRSTHATNTNTVNSQSTKPQVFEQGSSTGGNFNNIIQHAPLNFGIPDLAENDVQPPPGNPSGAYDWGYLGNENGQQWAFHNFQN